MAKPLARSIVLLATILTIHPALAQEAESTAAEPEAADASSESSAAEAASAEAADAAAGTEDAPAEADEAVDVAIPGIVITGRRDRNVQRSTPEVISVLGTEDIARTGEGDVAGALSRVTGLSVVGGGFVYVRGLGDRYSLALLNGSPLPSPEPLRRAVPLDLFPTDVIASTLVQKTYSPNFPGEFGGGVINLTTLAVPKTGFFKLSLGSGYDSETTNQIGYDYYGSETDWTGFDDGNRDLPAGLRAFLASGQRVSSGSVATGDLAKEFVNANNGLVQKMDRMPVNYSGTITGGNAWMLGESQLGLIATAGFDNKWRTRDNIEQTPGSFDLSVIDKDYRSVASENHAVANALIGLGYEFGEGNKLRWTNLYIHDTLKRTNLAEGRQNNQKPGADFREQSTAWYERQLLNTQLVGEFALEPLTIGARASYAESKREAPFELGIGHIRTNQAGSPFGEFFINRLDNGQTGFAQIAFSDLDEKLKSAGLDVSVPAGARVTLTAGVDYADTERDSTRREFQILAPSTFPSGVAMFRPDLLLSPEVIEEFGIGTIETTETDPAFTARLRTSAGYGQAQIDFTDALALSAGARYERGEQEVRPVQVFSVLTNSGASTDIENSYVLPAATLTYRFRDNMQMRFNASKTVARPQFRELMFQVYYDPESNRTYRGNPLLIDSEFFNAEARYEWYFASEQRISLAAFYKNIDKPIEAFTGFNDNTPVTSFANAPEANLYGVETEVQKYFPLDSWFERPFLATRRAVVISNYTYTNSEIKVAEGDTVDVFGTTTQPAGNFFRDGSQLTGQSDHIVNLQLGLENTGRLSQQTILLSYASDRVTSRGPAGLPDIHESPGMRLDFVAREGVSWFGQDLDLKLEVRNIFGREYKEFQKRGGNTIYFNRYDVGTTFAASISMNF